MKLAVAGKGGVGKTTLVALLAREAVTRGYRVIAVDADPDANLAMTLGFPEPIIPLAKEWDLIANRVGTGGLIKLNPTVDDIPDRYSVEQDGIRLLVLGGVRYRIVRAQSFVLVAVTAHGLNLPGSSQCVILLFGI